VPLVGPSRERELAGTQAAAGDRELTLAARELQAHLAAALVDSPILAIVPPGADMAVHVRVARLVKSQLWQSAAAPDVGLTRSLAGLVPLPLDFDKDVLTALLIFECDGAAPLAATLPASAPLAATLPVPAPRAATPPGAPASLAGPPSPSAPAAPARFRSALVLETIRPVPLADLVPKSAVARPAGLLGIQAHEVSGEFVAAPAPRLIVIASDVPYLVRVAGRCASADPSRTPDIPPADLWRGIADLAAPGELAFAARPSAAFKDMIRSDAARLQAKNLKAGMTGADLMGFSLDYNLVRLALETEGLAGSFDLARDADAGRVDLVFASKSMAPFATALAQSLADPLVMGLPALLGGAPLDEPPAEPLYRVRPDGSTLHLTMSRSAAAAMVGRLCDAARQSAGRGASADHLRTLGAAVRTYVAVHEAYPKTWQDLTAKGIVREAAIFENPSLKVHPPAGDYALVPMNRDAAARRPWEKVLAYEAQPPDAAPPAALNILFVDGHVEHMEYSRFQQVYRTTLEGLGH